MNRQNEQEMEELRVGRLLATGLEDMAKGTPCLTEEQLDALVAGALQGDERDAAINHIAGCAVCRHAFVVTSRLATAAEEEHTVEVAKSKVVPFPVKKVRPAWNYTVPLALAATLLLAIGLNRFFPGTGDAPLPGTPQPQQSAQAPGAQQVAQNGATVRKPVMTNQDSLLATAGELGRKAAGKELDLSFISVGQAGYAGSGGDEANRFHAGYANYGLLLACSNGNAQVARKAAASMHERLQRLDITAGDGANLIGKLEQFVAGSLGAGCEETAELAMAAMQKQYAQDPFFELGTFASALQISSRLRLPELLTGNRFRESLGRLSNLNKPAAVIATLSEINSIAAGKLDDSAWKRMEELAVDIRKQF